MWNYINYAWVALKNDKDTQQIMHMKYVRNVWTKERREGAGGRQGQGKGRKDKPKMAEICGHAGKMFACFGQIN